MAIKPSEVSIPENIVDMAETAIDDVLKAGILYGSPDQPEYWFTGNQRKMTADNLEELASRYREAGWEVEINERFIKLRNTSA